MCMGCVGECMGCIGVCTMRRGVYPSLAAVSWLRVYLIHTFTQYLHTRIYARHYA